MRVALRRAALALTVPALLLAMSLASCRVRDKRVTGLGNTGPAIDTTVGHAPAGVRIKVEVLNASKNRGAARKATLLLRDRGYDVVAMGTTRQQQAATLILDRSNHPEWALLISKVIGGKPVARPDTSRYLDATVVLGSDWTPPPMAFYP
ncbi:MAG: LytR C-terminal domain-containing protein [Gemmatimonadota bacterium]|nr:LytR C-terminal domain-containing protein [Gemmatimonadota bacterium]